MQKWNEFNKVKKTRVRHYCAMTGEEIPIGSSCWRYVGEWEGEFQSGYCTEKAKKFVDDNWSLIHNWNGFECQDVGNLMQEMEVV